MEQPKINGFDLLNKLGISTDTQIEGMVVKAAHGTNRPNVYQLDLAKDADSTDLKKVFCGTKSIEDGLLRTDDNDVIFIAPGFELYTNARDGNTVWIRNKTRALQPLAVI